MIEGRNLSNAVETLVSSYYRGKLCQIIARCPAE